MVNTNTDRENLSFPQSKKARKNYFIALILSFYCLDRFYLGYWKLGLLKIFTLGGLGVWYALDFFRILFFQMRDINGNKLRFGFAKSDFFRGHSEVFEEVQISNKNNSNGYFKGKSKLATIKTVENRTVTLYKQPAVLFLPFRHLRAVHGNWFFLIFPFTFLFTLFASLQYQLDNAIGGASYNDITLLPFVLYFFGYPLLSSIFFYNRIGFYLNDDTLRELKEKGIKIRNSNFTATEKEEMRKRFKNRNVLSFLFLVLFIFLAIYNNHDKEYRSKIASYYLNKGDKSIAIEFEKKGLKVSKSKDAMNTIKNWSEFGFEKEIIEFEAKNENDYKSLNEDYRNLPYHTLPFRSAKDGNLIHQELEVTDNLKDTNNFPQEVKTESIVSNDVSKSEESTLELETNQTPSINKDVEEDTEPGSWRILSDVLFGIVMIIFIGLVSFIKGKELKSKRIKSFKHRDGIGTIPVEQVQQEDFNFSVKLVLLLAGSFTFIGICAFLESDFWREIYKPRFIDLVFTTVNSNKVMSFISLIIPFASTSLFIELSDSNKKLKLLGVYFALISFLILNSVILSGLWYFSSDIKTFTPVFFSIAVFFFFVSNLARRRKIDVGSKSVVVSAFLFSLPFCLLLPLSIEHTGQLILASIATNIAIAILFYIRAPEITKLNIIGNEGSDEDRIELVLASLYFFIQIFNLVIIILKLRDRIEKYLASLHQPNTVDNQGNINQKNIKSPVESQAITTSNSISNEESKYDLDDNLSNSSNLDDSLSSQGNLDDSLSNAGEKDDKLSES